MNYGTVLLITNCLYVKLHFPYTVKVYFIWYVDCEFNCYKKVVIKSRYNHSFLFEQIISTDYIIFPFLFYFIFII